MADEGRRFSDINHKLTEIETAVDDLGYQLHYIEENKTKIKLLETTIFRLIFC